MGERVCVRIRVCVSVCVCGHLVWVRVCAACVPTRACLLRPAITWACAALGSPLARAISEQFLKTLPLALITVASQVQRLLKAMTAVDQDNYPETNGGIYIVNASFVFTAIWKMVQVCAPPSLHRKSF